MVQVTKLAHVGFRARNLSTRAEFYSDRWRLDRIDEHGGEMFFRADAPDHHVLTRHASDTPGLHHFAFRASGVQGGTWPATTCSRTTGTPRTIPSSTRPRWSRSPRPTTLQGSAIRPFPTYGRPSRAPRQEVSDKWR